MCFVEAKTYVKIRTAPGKNYTAVAQLSPNQTLQASCHATSGGSYSDCGGSNWWIAVTYNGDRRYVAHACVNWYYDSAAVDGDDAVAAEIRAEAREATVPPTPEPATQAEG